MLFSLIFLTLGKRKFHWLIQLLVIPLILLSVLNIFNYFFGLSFLNVITQHTPRALFASILTIVLCIAVLYSYPLGYFRFSFQKKIAGFFILAAFILSLIFFAFKKNQEHSIDTSNSIEHTGEVLFQSQQILTQALEIETGARGFVIVGKEEYLTHFNATVTVIASSVLELKKLTRDDPGQLARVDSLQKLVEESIRHRNLIIKTRKEEVPEAVTKITELGVGKNITEQIRTVIASILQEEYQLLAKRKEENRQNIQNSSAIISFFQVMAALLLLFAFFVIYKNTRLRDRAEVALLNSKEQFLTLANNISQLAWMADVNGFIFWYNQRWFDYTGTTLEEMKGWGWQKVHHPEHVQRVVDKIKNCFETGEVWEDTFPLRGTDDNYRWFLSRAVPIRNDDGMILRWFGTNTDVTKIKEAEKEIELMNLNLEKRVEQKTNELLKAEMHFREILDNLMEGATIIGFDWQYKYANNTALKQTGFSREKLLGYTIMEKYPDVEQTKTFNDIKRCLNERVTIQDEKQFTLPNGTSSYFEVSYRPIPDGVFILSMNITERKKDEEKIKQYTEEIKNSNIELERFAYVASHDLQEPLRMVSSFLKLLEKELDGKLNETCKEYIYYAVDGAARMKILVNDLLQYARVGSNKEDFSATNTNEIMDYVNRVLKEDIEQNHAVITVATLPVITANKTLISQLFINLVGNALKYHDGRVPEIEVGSTEKPDQWIFFVKDNGIGIDPKFFDRIFIIFQRLHSKNEFSGTGIGLAICKKIVEVHKGKIWVESEEGKGSTFYFNIPKNNR